MTNSARRRPSTSPACSSVEKCTPANTRLIDASFAAAEKLSKWRLIPGKTSEVTSNLDCHARGFAQQPALSRYLRCVGGGAEAPRGRGATLTHNRVTACARFLRCHDGMYAKLDWMVLLQETIMDMAISLEAGGTEVNPFGPSTPIDLIQELHMNYQQLGSHGPRVSAIGLGTMGMSDMYGPADRPESIATIHAALDRGVTLLDTGDFYGMGHNEMLLGEALKGKNREQLQLSVKFGALRGPGPGEFHGYDSRPAAVRNFIAYSLKRLGVEYLDIYRPARLDPNVPIEDTIDSIADLIKQGYVRYVGLSEVGAKTIRRAHAVHPIADVQIEYSLISRGIEREILPTCRDLGIGITAYGILSRGLISGHWQKNSDKGDFRSRAPRFQGENLDNNLVLVEKLRAVANSIGISVAQVAIAWVIAQAAAQRASIVPLIGARRRDRLAESLEALAVRLSPEQLVEIERAVPPDAAAGQRYPEAQLAHMDSERPQ